MKVQTAVTDVNIQNFLDTQLDLTVNAGNSVVLNLPNSTNYYCPQISCTSAAGGILVIEAEDFAPLGPEVVGIQQNVVNAAADGSLIPVTFWVRNTLKISCTEGAVTINWAPLDYWFFMVGPVNVDSNITASSIFSVMPRLAAGLWIDKPTAILNGILNFSGSVTPQSLTSSAPPCWWSGPIIDVPNNAFNTFMTITTASAGFFLDVTDVKLQNNVLPTDKVNLYLAVLQQGSGY